MIECRTLYVVIRVAHEPPYEWRVIRAGSVVGSLSVGEYFAAPAHLPTRQVRSNMFQSRPPTSSNTYLKPQPSVAWPRLSRLSQDPKRRPLTQGHELSFS